MAAHKKPTNGSCDAAFMGNFGLYETKAEAEKHAEYFRCAVDFQHVRDGRGGGQTNPPKILASPVRSSSRILAATPEPKDNTEVGAIIADLLCDMTHRVEKHVH